MKPTEPIKLSPQESTKPEPVAPSAPPTVVKRPYRKPTLTHYGTIADLTQSVGNAGSADAGPSPTNKTSIGPAGGARRR